MDPLFPAPEPVPILVPDPFFVPPDHSARWTPLRGRPMKCEDCELVVYQQLRAGVASGHLIRLATRMRRWDDRPYLGLRVYCDAHSVIQHELDAAAKP